MVTKVKTELEEEVQLSTSGGGMPTKELEKKVKSEESFESDEIDDEYLSNYCETAEILQPMMVSKELFIQTKWWPRIMLGCPNKIRNDSIR